MAEQRAVRLVVGLGNPGKAYAATRHNVGFMVVDEAAARRGLTQWRKKDGAEQAYDSSARVDYLKPLSFMNLSGAPVRIVASWYRTPPEDVLVVVDDMDLPFGRLRMRPFGGHGGHNGLRSLVATVGETFPRLRVGVGRPEFDSVDHVLGSFGPDERRALPDILAGAADTIDLWLNESLDRAMQFANTWQAARADDRA